MDSVRNSKGVTFYLHETSSPRGGGFIKFFSRDPEDTIDIPEGWEVVGENPRSGVPILGRKKKTWDLE